MRRGDIRTLRNCKGEVRFVLWAKFQAETLLFGGCDGLLQLPDDAQAACSQCSPHAEFMAAGGCARQQ
jgi:hypothetical protein